MQRAAAGLASVCAGLAGKVYGARIVVLAGSYLALSWFAFLHGPLRHWGFHLFGPVGPTLWPTHWMLYVLGFL